MRSSSQIESLHGDAGGSLEPREECRERNPARRPDDQLAWDGWINHAPFRWKGPCEIDAQSKTVVNEYVLECFCKRVQFSIFSDPLDVKICHCDTCKKLHGAPMQAAAVFHKSDARLTKGEVGDIAFFSLSHSNPHITLQATLCPRKIYCARCGSPLADEGKNMFIAYPSSMHWQKCLNALGSGKEWNNQPQEGIEKLPPAFNVRKHIFYGKRMFDIWDSVEKWEGLDGKSRKMANDGSIIQ